MDYQITNGPFEASFTSLKNYKCPKWFRDAKFGIWAHWGPQAVPMYGDWYARHMYIEGHDQYNYHCKTFGHPSKFGFKDIAKMFKAENFDPEALMKLYKDIGAKYFVALGTHHDNYDCFDSTYCNFNSVKVGPKKDIVGLFKEAADKYQMRFGITEHLERAYSWFNTNKGSDTKGPYKGIPYDGNDPEYEDYYFPKHPDDNNGYPVNPPKWWIQNWYDRTKEMVEKYKPDLFYTDGMVPFDKAGLSMIANFYNVNLKNHNGSFEAVYAVKDLYHLIKLRPDVIYGEYQEGIGTLDMERSLLDGIQDEPWQMDTCIGNWYYKKDMKYKTATEVIDILLDVVSKNGNLLINFPLKPDGTYDEETLKTMKEIGKFMQINGKAIYETTPFDVYGEGDTSYESKAYNEGSLPVYTSTDFRFTRKGNTIYAAMLNWPKDNTALIKTFKNNAYQVKSVSLIGSTINSYEQTEKGLIIKGLDKGSLKNAYIFEIKI